MDRAKIEEGVRLILEGIGEDPGREGLRETPRRVASMYEEIFSGMTEDASEHLCVTFNEGHQEMVLVRDIPLYSMCEHHLVPFMGRAHVAYIPGKDGRICGLSKLARVVDTFAKRPQVQERMTLLTQADGLLRFLFTDDISPDEKARKVLAKAGAEYLRDAASRLEAIEDWTAEEIERVLTALQEDAGLSRTNAWQPIRAAVSGSTVSPPLFESLHLLGKGRAVARLRAAAELV
jgi:GTP cyclohydrolase I